MSDTITITINISGLRAALDALLPGVPVAARAATPTAIDAMPEASTPPATDADGVAWDAALHAADRRLTRDGRWARKRGRPAAGGACVVEPHAQAEPAVLEGAPAVGDPVPNAAEAPIDAEPMAHGTIGTTATFDELDEAVRAAILADVPIVGIHNTFGHAAAAAGRKYDGSGILFFVGEDMGRARAMICESLRYRDNNDADRQGDDNG